MQAVFRFGHVEVVVSNSQAGCVLFEVYETLPCAVTAVDPDDPSKGNREVERRPTIVSLSKSEARSIASAMMGVAAEV
jgi:hypothetical protein